LAVWRRYRRLRNLNRHVHIRFAARCLDGVDADPLGVHALVFGVVLWQSF
jgi:hypothetical protein